MTSEFCCVKTYYNNLCKKKLCDFFYAKRYKTIYTKKWLSDFYM